MREDLQISKITAHFVCLLLACVSIPAAFSYADSDWQFWTIEALEHKVTSAWNARAEAEFHFDARMRSPFNRQADIGISRKVRDWLGISVNCHVVKEVKNGEWKNERRPHINATLYANMCGLRLSARNRMEYRILEHGDIMWRYRNKLRVGLPKKLLKSDMEAYVSNEIFVDCEKQLVEQNRVLVGVAASFLGYAKLEVYLMAVATRKKSAWTDVNVLGANIVLTL